MLCERGEQIYFFILVTPLKYFPVTKKPTYPPLQPSVEKLLSSDAVVVGMVLNIFNRTYIVRNSSLLHFFKALIAFFEILSDEFKQKKFQFISP
jgi:hypothetical protein